MTRRALDEAAVAEIERLYRGNDLTLAQIGARFGRSATAISQLARRRGWPMRWERMGRAPRKSMPSAPKARAALAHRLCDAIIKKLDHMEKGMQGDNLGSEDFERDAKAVASMMGSVDKAMTAAANADKQRKPKSAELAAGGEVERLQREIMERFERIQRRRNAEAGSQ